MKDEVERGSGSAGPSESTRAERLAASEGRGPEPTAIEQDTRDRDDHGRLADEARAQTERMAKELRGAKVPIETEPPTVYEP